MSYVKTVWVNDLTPVNSDNMNKIENGIEQAHNELSKLRGNTDTSMEDMDAKLDGCISYTGMKTATLEAELRERTDELHGKIELLPKGVISILSLQAASGSLAATFALGDAEKLFPNIAENKLKTEYKFIFRDKFTGDLYYGTIDELSKYDNEPELLKKMGNSSKDYDNELNSLQRKSEEHDESIATLVANNEERDVDVANLEERVQTLENASESTKPVAFVEVENLEKMSEAVKIRDAVKASGLVPEGAEATRTPAYVYDRNTKFLYKCTAQKVVEIYTSLAVGGTPEMPEKICYLGDMVSKQYVDDLFHSIVDGNEVEY